MNGIEKLHPLNHDLYRRVQHLVSLRWKWEAIALDVGVYSVNDLCEWVIAYKEPRKLPMVRAVAVERYRPPTNDTEKFLAWRRQHEGARRTREAAGL